MSNKHNFNNLSIHEVAQMLGVSADAIRIYEKEGLIQPDRNPLNGYRTYNQQLLERIIGIVKFRKVGFSIAEIRNMFDHNSLEDVMVSYGSRIDDLKQQLELLQSKLDLVQSTNDHFKNVKKGMNEFSLYTLPDLYIVFYKDGFLYTYEESKELMSSPVFMYGITAYSAELKDGAIDFGSWKTMHTVNKHLIDLSPWKDAAHTLPIIKGGLSVRRTFITDGVNIGEEELREALEFAKKAGYKTQNKIYAFHVFTSGSDHGMQFYYDTFIPLDIK